tara:strand:- start:1103 stop:1513 length:411 start_codon:yes stop_codon:yes gene_type:complete
MPKHKAITIDPLANKVLKKHPKFKSMYYKPYKFEEGNDVVATARLQRDIYQEKLRGGIVEYNSDDILIWDKRGHISGYEYEKGDYTGNTSAPLLKLSVRTNRKDLGLLEHDIDYAVRLLEAIKADIKLEANKLNKE